MQWSSARSGACINLQNGKPRLRLSLVGPRAPRVDPDVLDRAAELLNSIPDNSNGAPFNESDAGHHAPAIFSPNPDSDEALLEYQEFNKYLLAKSFFECREFDRCAAVFLPDSIISGIVDARKDVVAGTPAGKDKGKAAATEAPKAANGSALPRMSQKSLFLALYAKFMSGEKRKDEESEMVMGPQDLGTVINKQLLPVGRFLSTWFEERTTEDGEVIGSQGWLEYL